jgi:protein-tyrosine phosphatase
MFWHGQFMAKWSSPSEIIRGELYLGGRASTVDEDELLSRKVTHVVSLTTEDVELPGKNLKQLHIRLEDAGESDLLGNFERIFDFVEDARANHTAILIHCEAGISRSATSVIAYLIKYHNMSLLEAFQFTKERRRIINPNTGFVEQLRRFEVSLHPGTPPDPFPFVLYWLRNFIHVLKDVTEEEVHQAWTQSGNDLPATWNTLYEAYEEKFLRPSISSHVLRNVHNE